MPDDTIGAERLSPELDGLTGGDTIGAESPAGAAPGGERPGVSDAEREAAGTVATFVVGTLADMVGKRWPATAYTPDEKAAAVAVLVPVFVKYGITPAWLERWRVEVTAGVTFSSLAFVGYQRVKASRATAGKPAAPGGGALAAGEHIGNKVEE